MYRDSRVTLSCPGDGRLAVAVLAVRRDGLWALRGAGLWAGGTRYFATWGAAMSAINKLPSSREVKPC